MLSADLTTVSTTVSTIVATIVATIVRASSIAVLLSSTTLTVADSTVTYIRACAAGGGFSGRNWRGKRYDITRGIIV